MTDAERKVREKHPDAKCWRSVGEHVRGEGFRVRTVNEGVIGYGTTIAKAWANAASRLPEEIQ